jgi:hypothetical protein
MWSAGALAGYWDEVWRWGRVYAGTTFVDAPLKNGLLRTLNWAGFHAAIVTAAATAWPMIAGKTERRRWTVWILISLAGVVAGLRFFPRYYFQILPVVVLLAARGFAEMRGKVGRPRPLAGVVSHGFPGSGWCGYLLAALLLIPLARFAPTYFLAARDAGWRDTAMDRDSRAAARMVRAAAKPGDTLFVWGYRPEIYVYSHLPAATRFLDSQPLTGVPADRHLTQSTPVETGQSRARRAELAASRPTFVVDGLGEYNPRLAVTEFDDLRAWMAGYREVGRSAESVIYRRE